MRGYNEKMFRSEPDDAVAFFSSLAQSTPADWVANHAEGQLSADVIETNEEVVIVATMAGTRPEDIELHLQNDYLTIRGKRLSPISSEEVEYHSKECYWGRFSRTIVLPVDVNSDLASSEYRHGILTIRLPKKSRTSSIPIIVVEE